MPGFIGPVAAENPTYGNKRFASNLNPSAEIGISYY